MGISWDNVNNHGLIIGYIYIYTYIFMGFWWRYSWTYNGNLQLTICDRDSMWGWIATTSLWPLMCLMNYHFPSFISGSSPANHILCRPEGRNFHELQNLVQTCASHILPATYECQEKTQSFYQVHHFATGGFWPAQLVITSSARAPSILSISLGSLSPTKIFSCFLLINYISSSDRWPHQVIVDRTLLNKNLNQQFLAEEL